MIKFLVKIKNSLVLQNLMLINKNRLKTALTTIHKDEEGYFLSSKFIDLICLVLFNEAMGTNLHGLGSNLSFIKQDISNIMTIVFRLKWLNDLWTRYDIDNTLWMKFSECDISFFHIKFRSLFDHLAKIITSISDTPGQIKIGSFDKLKNWLKKSDDNVKKLGNDLAQFVLSCEWFDSIKQVGESIVHHGDFPLVFLVKRRILFNLYKKIKKRERNFLLKILMYNNNVVDFELYAGLYISYLIAYLEKFPKLAYPRLSLKRIGNDSRAGFLGLQLVKEWIEQLLSKLNNTCDVDDDGFVEEIRSIQLDESKFAGTKIVRLYESFHSSLSQKRLKLPSNVPV